MHKKILFEYSTQIESDIVILGMNYNESKSVIEVKNCLKKKKNSISLIYSIKKKIRESCKVYAIPTSQFKKFAPVSIC